MDELDHISDISLAAQEAMMAKRRQQSALEQEALKSLCEERECEGDCGGMIPMARLRARPTTRYCVDCQSEIERGRR